MQTAIDKLKAEMDGNQNNPYIQFVGDFLIKHIEANPDDAEKILAADKTVGKSLDAMQKVAAKKKVGNMAMLTPSEGLAVVFDYFGITRKPVEVPIVPSAPVPAAAPAPRSGFDVKLDDFLL